MFVLIFKSKIYFNDFGIFNLLTKMVNPHQDLENFIYTHEKEKNMR